MQYKTTPIPPNTLIGDLALPRFLKSYDLTDRWHVQQLTVTIARLAFEETWNMKKLIDGKPETRMVPVLYFKTKTGEEFPRGMCLDAATNVDNLRKATGCTTAGQVIGKRITIKVEKFRKDMNVLRIDPKSPASNGTQPEPSMPEPSIVDEMEPEDESEELHLRDIPGLED